MMADTLEDKAVLAALQEMRKALETQSTALLEAIRYVRRIDDRTERTNQRIDELSDRVDRRMADLDRRISDTNLRITEMKDDLSVIVRMELSGAFGNFELKMDNRLSAIESRLEELK